jgi:hypothetical protein
VRERSGGIGAGELAVSGGGAAARCIHGGSGVRSGPEDHELTSVASSPGIYEMVALEFGV